VPVAVVYRWHDVCHSALAAHSRERRMGHDGALLGRPIDLLRAKRAVACRRPQKSSWKIHRPDPSTFVGGPVRDPGFLSGAAPAPSPVTGSLPPRPCAAQRRGVARCSTDGITNARSAIPGRTRRSRHRWVTDLWMTGVTAAPVVQIQKYRGQPSVAPRCPRQWIPVGFKNVVVEEASTFDPVAWTGPCHTGSTQASATSLFWLVSAITRSVDPEKNEPVSTAPANGRGPHRCPRKEQRREGVGAATADRQDRT
jgi:hypothetical protein